MVCPRVNCLEEYVSTLSVVVCVNIFYVINKLINLIFVITFDIVFFYLIQKKRDELHWVVLPKITGQAGIELVTFPLVRECANYCATSPLNIRSNS